MDEDLEDRLPKLPEPPPMRRRFRLHVFQWILVPIVFLGPVALALSGALGESRATVNAEGSDFRIVVEYPARIRYKQPTEIQIAVESRSLSPQDTLTISLDSTYSRHFCDVRSIPALTRPYSLKLAADLPRERISAFIEVQAERFGIHAGDLVVAGRDTLRVRLRTIVFP